MAVHDVDSGFITQINTLYERSSSASKVVTKDMYHIVSSKYTSDLTEKVNKFVRENPDYEVTNERFYLSSDYCHVVFKLKEVESSEEVTIKD